MTIKDPAPGAHNHIKDVPKASLDYVREMGDAEGWQPAIVGGEPTEAFRSAVQAHVDAELDRPKKQWYEVTIIGHILATSPEHAGAIALTTHKGIGLGGRASWGLRSVTGPCGVEGRNA